MNTTININLIGKGNVESVLKNASTAVHRFTSDAVSSNREMAQSSSQVSTAISKIGSAATGTTSPLSRMGSIGEQSNVQIAKSGEVASQSIARTGTMGLNAGRSISQGATVASKGVENVTKSAENASHGLSEMSNLLGMLMGGYGAMQIASAMWTGATTKQFNAAYLGTKMSTAAANEYISQIQKIVAEVPGDDTFMNNLMTGAVAKQTNLTTSELKMLGIVSADYLTTSQNMGKSALETQMDLKEYVLTGNTSQLERDSILKQQMSTLEDQGTVSERILALNKALQAEGYAGLSQLDIASIKAEELKGKFQLAGTAIGEKILPYLEKGVDYLLELDEKTGGWSTQIGLAGAGVVALGLALGPVVWSAKEVLGSFSGISDKIKGITSGGKKKIDLDCNPCPDDSQVGGSGKKGKSTSGSGGGFWTSRPGQFLSGLSLVPALSSTGAGSWAAMSGATAAGTVAGAGVLGLGTGFGLNKLDEYLSGSAGDAWTGFKGMAGIVNPLNMMFAPLQTGAQSFENLLTGKNPLDPIVSFFKGDTHGWGLGGLGGSKGLSGLLGGLLPGTSHAAGGGSSKGIMDDITGKGGFLDFSRFKIPQFKWPSPSQILNDIINQVKGRIPELKWHVPNVGQILGQTWDRINPLNWRIPGVSQLLGQTWERINPLNWNIPGVGSLLGQTWEKITTLWWQVPGIGDILGLIGSRIGPFIWPMGPAKGPQGPGYTILNSPPAGPIKNTIASTMAARSGVGSGYIRSALDRNFAGVDAFNFIADGMAAPLNYQFYFGDQKTNQQVWDSGLTNCFDGAQFLMSEARQRFGLSAGLSNGVWDGTGIVHTWSNIGGRNFDMAAKLIRGQWNPPSGPGTFHDFMTDIGPGLEWRGYAGHQMDPVTALAQGGNCYDMSLGAMIVASQLYGKPAEMMWGTWDDQSHVWTKIDGREYDPLRRARDGTFTPPPQGPGTGRIPGSLVVDVGGIHIHGDVHGVDDLEGRLNKAEKEAGENIAARIFSQFGG